MSLFYKFFWLKDFHNDDLNHVKLEATNTLSDTFIRNLSHAQYGLVLAV